MKKCMYALVILFTSYFAKSQTNHVSVKTSIEEIEQIHTWHFLLGLNDGSSLFFWTDPHRTQIFMKRFDKETKYILEKEVWELKSKKGGRVEISEIYEINKTVVFSMAFRTREEIKYYKLILDPTTGETLKEETLVSYEGIKHEFIENENYFFNCTKNDSLGLYRLMNFTRLNENTNELKIYDYDYNHKLISSFSKKIENTYSSVKLIANIQVEAETYFSIDYLQRIDKGVVSTNEQKVIIYKFADGSLKELPFVIEKAKACGSYVVGQFTSTLHKEIKLAICNKYSIGKDASCRYPLASEITVLTFSKNTLEIKNKYEITNKEILNSFDGIKEINENEKAHLFNIPVSFRINSSNQDEFIFQSFKLISHTNYIEPYTEDIGVFNFNNNGTIISQKFFPYKSDVVFLKPFINNPYKNGNTSNYYGFSPISDVYFMFDFISKNNAFFLLYNDLPENINTTNRNEVKMAKLNKMTGIVLMNNETGWHKSSILGSNNETVFDFTSSSFNEKTGIYSVISRDDSKKLHISYLTFK